MTETAARMLRLMDRAVTEWHLTEIGEIGRKHGSVAPSRLE